MCLINYCIPQAGTYVLNNVCTNCPAGFYCDDATVGMIACPDGTYQTATGQTTCDDCPGGQECPSASGAASNCNAGYYSPSGVSTCSVSTYPGGENSRVLSAIE